MAVPDAGVDLGVDLGVEVTRGLDVLLVRYQRGPQLGGGAPGRGVGEGRPGQGGGGEP